MNNQGDISFNGLTTHEKAYVGNQVSRRFSMPIFFLKSKVKRSSKHGFQEMTNKDLEKVGKCEESLSSVISDDISNISTVPQDPFDYSFNGFQFGDGNKSNSDKIDEMEESDTRPFAGFSFGSTNDSKNEYGDESDSDDNINNRRNEHEFGSKEDSWKKSEQRVNRNKSLPKFVEEKDLSIEENKRGRHDEVKNTEFLDTGPENTSEPEKYEYIQESFEYFSNLASSFNYKESSEKIHNILSNCVKRGNWLLQNILEIEKKREKELTVKNGIYKQYIDRSNVLYNLRKQSRKCNDESKMADVNLKNMKVRTLKRLKETQSIKEIIKGEAYKIVALRDKLKKTKTCNKKKEIIVMNQINDLEKQAEIDKKSLDTNVKREKDTKKFFERELEYREIESTKKIVNFTLYKEILLMQIEKQKKKIKEFQLLVDEESTTCGI